MDHLAVGGVIETDSSFTKYCFDTWSP